MRSTFYGMEVARSGLYTSQNELNVTGHNIANVDTAGYTRQRLNTSALPALSMNVQFAVDNRATAGRGVEAQTVDQIRNLFTDAKYREESSSTSYWEVKSDEFYMVEQLFSSVLEQEQTSASIWNALDVFKTALYALEENPSSKDLRTNLLTAANQLTESFRYVYGKLEEQHDNLNSAVEVTVRQINELGVSIANLNRQIFGYELTGAKANDLRDERNLLLDQLSELVDIRYSEDSQGYLTVTIGGRELVKGVESYQLTVDPRGSVNQLDVLANAENAGTQYKVVWADAMGNPSTSPNDVAYIQGGELKAYIDLRDGATENNPGIPYAAELLNDLARLIAKEVNDLHRQGYTMPFTEADAIGTAANVKIYAVDSGLLLGDTMQTVTAADGTVYYESMQGINFFDTGAYNDYSKITAGSFQVSSEIKNNVFLIAASSSKVTISGEVNADGSLNQQTGNAENLKRITALYDRKNELGLSDNFQDRLKSLYTSIANEMDEMNTLYASQQTRLLSISQQRQSESSVSLDEEMTNVVRFTHAYNANARVITAIDEELDVLINRLGRVGL